MTSGSLLFEELRRAALRPQPFATYTADTLWTDEHISSKMLEYHLNPDVGLASRKAAFIDASVEWICERFGLGDGTSVADFGCGPGLYASRFAERGSNVTGIDFSRRSIEYARGEAAKRGLPIEYVLADYLEFETEARFDLITMIFCDFCALSPRQRAALLARFRSFLKNDGSLLMDVSSLAAFGKWTESNAFGRRMMNGFWAPGDYYGFRASFKYERERVTLDKYTIVEPERRWEVYNWLQYFNIEALRSEFSDAGLSIVETYSDVAGRPYDAEEDQFAVVARRDDVAVTRFEEK
jgi:SAM-dependent methyltransferase